jgi:two-component system alkaline phosphatase synthesis response regulator PhoP
MNKKILVCDDARSILETLSYLVKKAGFICITAEDGEAAVEMANREKPDLVFLDVSMPKLNGYEACKAIKENADTKHAYIIILTANGQAKDKEAAFTAGANEYMSKPFSPREIMNKLETLLK